MAPGVYYLHIAKTAGTTLRWFLEGQYPPSTCAYVYHQHEKDRIRFARLSAKAYAQIQCFSSNAPLGTHRDLQSRLRVITMLREPVSRVLSLYLYRKTLPEYRGHPIHTLPALDYLDRMAANQEDNVQVRLLSGQGQQGEVTAHTLEQAKIHLHDTCAAFGLRERFDESLVLFGRVFGWTRLLYVTQNTSHSSTSSEDIEMLRRIEILNQFDSQLYEYAQELFEARVSAQPIKLEEQRRVHEARGIERLSIYAGRVIRKLRRP